MIGLRRSPVIVGLTLGILVGLLVAAIRQSGRLERWELTAYDWSLSFQPNQTAAGSPIVLIGITEQDVHALGQWPLTDTVLAEVLKKLVDYQPRVIGVDIYRNFSVPPGREALEAVLTDHPNIIMVMKYGSETQVSVPALPILHEDRLGFNDLLLDSDGIVRRGLLFIDDGQRTLYSFALRLALLYLKHDGIVPQPDPTYPEHLRLGRTSFHPLESNDGAYVDADMRGYQILLDFIGARTPFPSYSLSALLSGAIDLLALKDKLVLVGVTAESVPDVFHIPYNTALVDEQRSIYGVIVHAHIAAQLLHAALGGRGPVQTVGERAEVLWILLWGLAGGTIGTISRSTWRFLGFITIGLVLLGGLVQSLFLNGWWIPVIPPALSWLVSAALATAYVASQEKRQRAFLMQLFSRHVSQEVAEAIWQQRDQFWDGSRPRSQKVLITVMFTDLEAFTATAEKMDPQALMDWTNEYIEIMAQLITKHGGVVDDYFGDAIKANFGVPVPRTTEAEIRQDALNAVECALAMETEMRRLNALWKAQNLPTMRMRVGIYTGLAVAGSQGSAQRLKYTTLGDTVNIAARLESFGKEAGEPNFGDRFCRILIGQTTLEYIGDAFETETIGEMTLRGKQEKIKVYRLVGIKSPSSRI
ncbi:MAG TPA: adenylate/guanylate cyclase domain-containing protein [Nitrospira sp.]|nr:adenylate/guanylate cyclase domain-containing protein [Nitrospira sp.]